jgi:hypothetical protein
MGSFASNGDTDKSSLSPLFVTNMETPMPLLFRWSGMLILLPVLAGCGEPLYENAGSSNSLLEDREACAMEIDRSPAAMAYRQNPVAHADYPSGRLRIRIGVSRRKGGNSLGHEPKRSNCAPRLRQKLIMLPSLSRCLSRRTQRPFSGRLNRQSSVQALNGLNHNHILVWL